MFSIMLLIPIASSLVAGAIAIYKLHQQKDLAKAIGSVLQTTFDGLTKNPALTLGIVAVTSATGTIVYLARKHTPSFIQPSPPDVTASEKEWDEYAYSIYQYSEHLRTQQWITVGFVAITALVFTLGMSLAYKIGDAQVKITELTLMNQVTMQKLRQIEQDSMKDVRLAEARSHEKIKKIFTDTLNAKSPSAALITNDMNETITLQAQHTWGVFGGQLGPPKNIELLAGEAAVVPGNRFSWGIGAGVKVSVKDATGKTISHGQTVNVSKLAVQDDGVSK
jgi:hypothetical protein